MDRRRLLSLTMALPLGLPRAALALAAPEAAVVLTVTGKVRNPNLLTAAAFDMPMLERLPQSSFVTHTPWYAQARKFTGPLLRDVLAAAGGQGGTVRAVALNDYRVDIPYEDAQRFDVLVARLLDDKPMAVRDKGPLFIIYPFDQDSSLRNALYYTRCAWQLKGIEVL